MTNAESKGTFQTERHTPRHIPRRASRAFPDSPLVICFPSGNRGIVVDISPGGVGFLAGAPLEEDEPICFTISGKSVPMTEAAGELMWRDSAGKRAGVRFTHVPEGLREVINHLSIKHLSIKAPINHSHTFSHMPISHTPTNHTFDHTPIRHSQPEKNNPSRGIENIATPAVGANKVAAPLSATRKRFGAVAKCDDGCSRIIYGGSDLVSVESPRSARFDENSGAYCFADGFARAVLSFEICECSRGRSAGGRFFCLRKPRAFGRARLASRGKDGRGCACEGQARQRPNRSPP